ncbi:MAG TPA: glycosyltransferase family 1 protein [Solirubrobacteraceae bacterium]|jgi:glycosyltransferase involved in cell wall biosynthesis|nr:glycosyltransferase family 1 protein [Solirubrobacteraceae bacterium]
MRRTALPVTLVLSPGTGSMEVLGRELSERLAVRRFDAGRFLGQAEAFNLTPARAAARLGREVRLLKALRDVEGLIHFPNHHHARYGLGIHQPYVVTVHDLVRHLDDRRSAPLIHRPNRIDRRMLGLDLAGIRQAAALIAVSESTKRELIEHLNLDPQRIRVIHPGIDLDRFHPVKTPSGPYRYLLFVGSEQPRKNLAALLEALRLVKRSPEHAGLKLIKVGSAGGSEAPFRRQTLRLIASLGLERDVELAGRVTHRRLLELLSGAACLVQPSWHEGFGLPPLEGMACGCPVIVSDRGALPETAGPAAIVTSPAPEALAAEIELVLGDPDLREALRLAGLTHVQRFGWGDAAARTLDLYRSVWPGGIPRLRSRTLRLEFRRTASAPAPALVP